MPDAVGDQVEVEAMSRSVVTEFENYVKLNKKISPEVVGAKRGGLSAEQQLGRQAIAAS